MSRYTIHLAVSIVALIVLVGCQEKPPSQPSAQEPPAAPPQSPAQSENDSAGDTSADEVEQPDASAGDTPMEEVHLPAVNITAAESARHGLPAADIQLNVEGVSMSGWKFPEQGEYLVLSGPPGGPMGMSISHVQETPSDASQWKALMDKRYPERSAVAGSTSTIEVAGEKRAAFVFTTDEGFARAHHLMIPMAIASSGDAVLVDLYYGADETPAPTPETMAAYGAFTQILNSLSIRIP
jgi:hypothetical protein